MSRGGIPLNRLQQQKEPQKLDWDETSIFGVSRLIFDRSFWAWALASSSFSNGGDRLLQIVIAHRGQFKLFLVTKSLFLLRKDKVNIMPSKSSDELYQCGPQKGKALSSIRVSLAFSPILRRQARACSTSSSGRNKDEFFLLMGWALLVKW